MVPKQLIVAVEGTAAVGPFWPTIVSDYLDKIIRGFCGNKAVDQAELSLVMFNSHGSYSACLVQRSGWTKDMDVFFQWLSAIPFAGGGFNDAAIAEGLSEALTDGQRHCILIAASNPCTLPAPVYRPQPQNIGQSENMETQFGNCLSDAEALAKSFAQFGISLSVICPRKLPKLREIYDAGKRNPRSADPPVDSNVKNPHFLVLISENFKEARAALSRSGMSTLPSNQSPVKMDVSPVPPIYSSPPVSVSSANGPILGRQSIPVGKNVPPATVKVEPTTHVSPPTGPTYSQENAQDMKPFGAALRAANVRILNDVAPMISNVISSAMVGPTNPPPTTQTMISSVSAGGVTSIVGPTNLGAPQMMQMGNNMGVNNNNQNMMSGSPGSVTSGVSSGSSNITVGGATSGMNMMNHQMQPGVTNMPLTQQVSSAMQSGQTKYVKMWEGNLSGQRQGQPVFITRLEGYRNASASETLAANWPPSMHIVRLISQDHMSNKQHIGKADFLVFRAMDQHGFIGQLQEKKLCAVIQLPSQTLLLTVSDKAHRLIGMLFPGDMVVFKPQMPSQYMQPLQQQNQINQMHPQHQQMGMNQGGYMQGGGSRPQMLAQSGQVSSQGATSMPRGDFMN